MATSTSSHQPRRGWHESRCRWLSSAGSAGASQSAWPRRGWRWAHRPPRMLHHEEMSAPAPLLPACQPVLHPCRWEGLWSDRAQKPSIESTAEASRRVEAPHCIPPWAPGQQTEAFAAAGAKPEPGLQNPAALRRLGKRRQTPAPGAGWPSAGALDWQQFPQDFAEAPATAATPPGAGHTSLRWDFGKRAPALPILSKRKGLASSITVRVPSHPLREGEED